MEDERRQILDWIEADREEIVAFLRAFLRIPSPNPPGDTREAAGHLTRFLEAEGIEHRVIAPEPTMPNIVASLEGGAPGRHLVLNGHIDVFPVAAEERWTTDPWAAEMADGRIYGRGACDMKAGTTASLFTYRYLARLRERLSGRLTLTAVSDEETFGPWGARYLMEHHPEVHGDCLLNAEPSSPWTIRFAEKGVYWLRLTVPAEGGHGAYGHLSASPTRTAAHLIADLESLCDIEPAAPGNVAGAIEAGRAAMDRAMGEGAGAIADRITLNIGQIHAGVKVNMIPSACTVEADIRLPVGADRETVRPEIDRILARYPGVEVEELSYSAPCWCDPDG
jgi:succinyl-diaminopimelate desuccinylase